MSQVKTWVEKVSPKLEFILVIIVAFGSVSVNSLFFLLSKSDKVMFTGVGLIVLLVYEIVVLIALGWFLKQRGWTLQQLGVTPSWKSTTIGIGLVPTVYILYGLTWIGLALLFPEIQKLSQTKVIFTSNISLWQIILVSVINPIFEEVFVCGYIIKFFLKFNKLWIAVIVSTLVRTLYHLYQPIQGIVFIMIIGLVFGWFYVKTNRLWSAIVAHSFFDLLGFLHLSNS